MLDFARMTSFMKPGYCPLERVLSKLGIASRTVARTWIHAGRVRVNGVIRADHQLPVFLEGVKIQLDGRDVSKAQRRVFLLHKPRGVITSRLDEQGRATVFSFLKELKVQLHAVGRLDFATSGLLILTNDTYFSSWLTNPETAVSRKYAVSARGEITEEKLILLRAGIENAGEILRPSQVDLRKTSKKESHLTVELKEGKNREIRRLFLAVGNEVIRLKRLSFGDLSLGSLKVGEYREVFTDELYRAFPEFCIRN